MALDLVMAVLVGAFALRGFLRGTARAGIDLLGWVGAYAAAWTLGPVFAPRVVSALGVPDLAARAIASLGVALAVWIAFSVVSAIVGRRRRRGPPPGAVDRLGGALLGAAPALLLVTLVGWGAAFVSDLSRSPGLETLPRTEDSRVAGFARGVVASGAEWIWADAGAAGTATAAALADPAGTLERVRTLVDDPRVRDLGGDAAFWNDVEAGRLDAALAQPAFLRVAHAPELRDQFATLGLLPSEGKRDSIAFRAEARTALAEIGPRLRALRNDPALARLASDPEVQRHLQSGNTLGLLSHPDVRALVARALEDNGAPAPHAPGHGGR